MKVSIVALLLLTGAFATADGQARMVDVHVRSSKQNVQQEFTLMAKRTSLTIEQPAGSRQLPAGDTLRLKTPFTFSADLAQGPVLLHSATTEWVSAEVLLQNGSIIGATSQKLRIGVEGSRVEVRGVP